MPTWPVSGFEPRPLNTRYKIKFPNSPLCSCRGSTGQNVRRTLTEMQSSSHSRNEDIKVVYSGFGGLEVAYWPLVPKFAGSNPAKAVGFFRAIKILSTPSFIGEVKPFGPIS